MQTKKLNDFNKKKSTEFMSIFDSAQHLSYQFHTKCKQSNLTFTSQTCYLYTVKQDAHGQYCSPEKQSQSINTFVQSYDYTIMLIKRERPINYILFLRIKCFLFVNPLCPWCFVPSLKFHLCNFTISLLSLEK